MLEWLTARIGDLDSAIRKADFRISRTVGGPLTRWDVSRHTWAAAVLPSALTFFIVNGPALRLWPPRVVIAILAALVSVPLFLAVLRISARRRWPLWLDAAAQGALLAAVGAIVWWVAGDAERERDGGVYRHAFVPLAWLVAAVVVAAAALARAFLRSSSMRATVPYRLLVVELFVRRPRKRVHTWAMLGISAVTVLTSALGRLLLPPCFAVLFVPRELVGPVFAVALLVNLVLLAFARLDRRFDAAWDIPNRLVFRGWARLLSVVVVAIGLARVFDFQYVTTVLDGAHNRTLFGIIIGAYVLVWWQDYWISTFIAARVLDVLGPPESASVPRVAYPILPDYVATRVRADGRFVQSHGAGRLIVVGILEGGTPAPAFQLYEPFDLLEALADRVPEHDPGRADIDAMQFQVRAHFLCVALLLAGALAAVAARLHAAPQLPHVEARTTSAGTVDPAALLFPQEACGGGQMVIALSASGGGTRAALYTTSVLERLHRRGRLGQVRLVSGVSGGGAALAYFAAHRRELLAAPPGSAAWETYFARMRNPYIEDVLDGVAEWRVVANHRLGRLLAESFTARWALPQDGTFKVLGADVGLILNTALAGRFLRGDPGSKPLSLGELEQMRGRSGLSDVAGGRLVFTNLDVPQHFDAPGLFTTPDGRIVETRDARLPVVVVSDTSVSLAAAAAANANFPPVFSNTAVDVDDERRYWVTDGGAIDNRGLETLLFTVRHALARLPERCAKPPAIHVVEVEASAFSDGYRQDRGIGSVMAAGSAFASQLSGEILATLRSRTADRGAAIRFHYLPMPAVLRRAGSVGTHWMLQERVTVCLDASCAAWPPWSGRRRTLTGGEVVTILRALDGTPLPTDASDAARTVFCVALKEAATANWGPLRDELSAGTPAPAAQSVQECAADGSTVR